MRSLLLAIALLLAGASVASARPTSQIVAGENLFSTTGAGLGSLPVPAQAAGDVTGDGVEDLVGASNGTITVLDGRSHRPVLAFAEPRGLTGLAAGDGEIATAAQGIVRVYDASGTLTRAFSPCGPAFRGAVSVALDGGALVTAGAGAVHVYDGDVLTRAFGASGRVAAYRGEIATVADGFVHVYDATGLIAAFLEPGASTVALGRPGIVLGGDIVRVIDPATLAIRATFSPGPYTTVAVQDL